MMAAIRKCKKQGTLLQGLLEGMMAMWTSLFQPRESNIEFMSPERSENNFLLFESTKFVVNFTAVTENLNMMM
jgi:hypothetical protein